MSLPNARLARVVSTILSVLILSACGAKPVAIPDAGSGLGEATATWPAALPADCLQPWEELDAQGYVVPPGRDNFGGKSASAINALSEFVPGVEYETAAGDSTPLGEGLRLASGAVGGGRAIWV